MSTQQLTPEEVAKTNAWRVVIDRFVAARIRPSNKAVLCFDVIEEAVKESRHGIPEGHLYAAVLSLLNLDEFQSIIAVLKAEKKVKVSYHLVTWIGKGN